MVISDLITDQELAADQVNSEKWCECIDGALTKNNYISCIREAGFQKVDVLEERDTWMVKKLMVERLQVW